MYGGRAGWRLMGCVAVFACYWTSATFLTHVPVPEPIVLHGGRTGWKRTVFFSHTYRSQYNVRMAEGRDGKERCSLSTGSGANIMYGGRTGWKRTVFFSHT